jgi:hypothetical protein
MTKASMDLLWSSELSLQEDLLDTRLTSFFAPEGSDAVERLRTVEAALSRAAELRTAGHEALHFIDAELASTAGVVEAALVLGVPGSATDRAALTTIWHGDFTAGLEHTDLRFP